MKKPECAIDKNGNKRWFLNGEYHREDGPAVEFHDGRKYWYRNDKLHREDGPAVEYSDGYKIWYFNGKLHREDGPAIEYTNGCKEWYINGVEYYTEEEYYKTLYELGKISKEEYFLRVL
jgi:hypothetical protein